MNKILKYSLIPILALMFALYHSTIKNHLEYKGYYEPRIEHVATGKVINKQEVLLGENGGTVFYVTTVGEAGRQTNQVTVESYINAMVGDEVKLTITHKPTQENFWIFLFEISYFISVAGACALGYINWCKYQKKKFDEPNEKG